MSVFKQKQARSSQEATTKDINTQRKNGNQQQYRGEEKDNNYHMERVMQHQTQAS